MVQEARLDLSRPAAIVGLALGLAAGSIALAHAQPLIPNPGLTTLMQPQRLDRSRPLMPEDRAAGTRLGAQQGGSATPCDRRGSASPGGFPAASAGSSLYGSGSGPGDYGRYIPGTPPPPDPAAKKPGSTASQPGASRTAAADRPLYGGVDRPLWDTGERRAAAPVGTAPGKPASPGEAGTASRQPNSLPAPVRDRPLWAARDPSSSDDPPASPEDTTSPGATGGFAPSPCTASSAAPITR